jgi:sugar phosphate isomerase/epimerase
MSFRIGVNAARRLFWGYPLRTRLKILENFLEIFGRFKEDGEEWYVELGISGFGEIFLRKDSGFEIDTTLAMQLRQIVEGLGFKLTLHAPHSGEILNPSLNLCSPDPAERRLSLSLAKLTLRLAELLDANMVTFHPGWLYTQETPQGVRQRIWSRHMEYAAQARKILVENLKKLTAIAEKLGREMTIENMEPRWDVFYILVHPTHVKEVIEEVGSKWLGMTYDAAHAYLAASYYAFDQLKNFKALAKHVRKIHIHDNLGKPGLQGEKDFARGIGDLHLMPLLGKGNVPNRQILELSRGKIVIYEILPTEVEFRRSLRRLRGLFA